VFAGRGGRGLIEDGRHEALLDGGVEVGMAGVNGPDRVFDFFGGRVLGEIAARAGLEAGKRNSSSA